MLQVSRPYIAPQRHPPLAQHLQQPGRMQLFQVVRDRRGTQAVPHAHIDLALLEVGLGGRLDATNVVDPIISVITDIGIDHIEFLGANIAKIAGERAGILRPNRVFATLSQHPEANARGED